MSALDHFLDEVRAAPQMRAALADDPVLKGENWGVRFNQTGSKSLADMVAMFDHAASADDPVAIEVHDGLVKIVTRAAPIGKRLQAIVEFLKPYDPAWQARQ
jgi:hypothetical protein